MPSSNLPPASVVFSIEELRRLIVRCIEHAPSLYSLLRVSREVRQWTERELADVYNLHNAFGHFFDVARFRHVQALTGAIITGSQALAFMGLYTWAAHSDLDVVVAASGVAHLASFLLSEDYEFVGDGLDAAINRLESARHRHTYGIRSVEAVLTFKRSSIVPVTKIDVIVAVSPMACILGFHSTVVMNGIAWDCAFSLFPRATFVRQQGLVTVSDVGAREQLALAKYRSRGFQMAREWALVGGRDLDEFMPMVTRRVGDQGCWMLYFDHPVHDPRTAHRVDWNTFRIWRAFVGCRDQLQLASFAMEASVLRSPLLTYRYTVPSALCAFAEDILCRVEDMARAAGWGDDMATFMSFVHVYRGLAGIYILVGEPLRSPTSAHHCDTVVLGIAFAFMSSMVVVVCDDERAYVHPLPPSVAALRRSGSTFVTGSLQVDSGSEGSGDDLPSVL